MTCSRCNAPLVPGSMFCSKCGLAFGPPVPSPQQGYTPAPSVTAKASDKSTRNAAVILGLIIALCGGSVIYLSAQDHSPPDQPDTSASSSSASSGSLEVGDTGYITAGGGQVYLGATEEDQKELTQEAIAKDDTGITKMIVSGHAFFVNGGTSARLIGHGGGLLGFSVCHVRILDGDHATDDGWLPVEWLKK